jgi:tartrate dehydrogenase/decarboxylase/D-malate dehydrogenase
MKKYNIAVIAGDGIGKEVVPEGMRVLEAAGRRFGFEVQATHFDWSCQRFHETGRFMPEDGLQQLATHDSIFLGAVGWPGVPDHISLWGLLIPIRRHFDQYVNLRPVRLMKGVESPLRGREPGDIDFYVVRENCGEFRDRRPALFGTENELANRDMTRPASTASKIRLRLAMKRKHLTSATKSNGIIHTMPYWDERFAAMGKNFPEVRMDQYHIDILTAHFVRYPDRFDVVVGSNLFGDILSDLGPAVTGSIGIAPSGNINPERKHPSMFEPVHGSAPDIAGKKIANPIGQIWSGALMLDHLGLPKAGRRRMRDRKVMDGPHTPG